MRCRALDRRGQQCKGVGVGEYSFSINSELDSSLTVSWVLVPFCKKHVNAVGETETHTEMMARYRRERRAAIRRNNAEKERTNRSK
jgi:hypothetical protein